MSTGRVIVPNVGEEYLLDQMTSANFTLKLFTNDWVTGKTSTQLDATVASDFTEATFTGYSAATLTGGSWVSTAGDPSTNTYALQTFTRSGGSAQTIRGYYIIRASGGALVMFEQFTSGIALTSVSDAITIRPNFTLDDTSEGTMPTGSIIATGRTTAPTGWVLCDGTAISRTTFSALFAAISTTYGVGDGSTTFNVPDLRQRFPMGKAASGTGATLGGTGGLIDHIHALATTSSGAKIFIAAGSPYIRMFRKTVASYNHNNESTTALTVAGASSAQTLAAELIGDSGTANPPFQVVNFIIKT